jgi:SPP1 family phage portal protein
MEIVEIQSIYKTEPAKLVSGIIETKPAVKDLSGTTYKTEDFIKQFDPKGHKVLDPGHRPNKIKKKDGQSVSVPVSRLPIPLQKIIVKRAVSFLLGNPVKIKGPGENEAQQKIEAFVKKLWQDSKLDYLNKDLARILFSETEAAEIWFSEQAEKGYWEGTAGAGAIDRKLRVKIVSEGTKDKLYPVFSKSRDLVAFGRYYSVQEAGETVEQFDLYQEKTVTRYAKKTKDWEFVEEGPHGFDKMPIVYYKIDWPLWFDVQEMIERFETRLSNFADTNDYFGDPIITVKGEVQGFADKGESGKLLQLTKDAEANYLTWQHAPESTKLEFETLIKLIFSMTQTPDISFESVKGIGQVSGVALELLFLDAHLKAKENETFFGLGIQRRLNFLTHAAALLMPSLKAARQTVLEPVFTPYMPSNVKETVALLGDAVGGKAVMSISTAVRNNPLVSDPNKELELMKEDSLGGLEE